MVSLVFWPELGEKSRPRVNRWIRKLFDGLAGVMLMPGSRYAVAV